MPIAVPFADVVTLQGRAKPSHHTAVQNRTALSDGTHRNAVECPPAVVTVDSWGITGALQECVK